LSAGFFYGRLERLCRGQFESVDIRGARLR